MRIFQRIIEFSRSIASSKIEGATLKGLKTSDLFTNEDIDYIQKNLSDADLLKERHLLKRQINKDKDFKKLQDQLSIPKSKIRWNYVAVAILVGIIVSSVIITSSPVNHSFQDEVFLPDAINPGTDKATLTLEDGSKIQINKDTELTTKSANIKGKQIVYNNSTATLNDTKYNYLTIPRGGQFSIVLSDGTKVWLNSESQLKYPIKFIEGTPRVVELIYGEAYFDVSPVSENQAADFHVLHNDHAIQVLGTEFNLKSYKDESKIYTTLVEGEVTINFKEKKHLLSPNEQSVLNLHNNKLTVSKVDVYAETSWKDGIFAFEKKPLKEIMAVLSRWYDIKVIFTKSDVSDKRFYGALRKDQNITSILERIKEYDIIKEYEIKGKTIVLR